MELKEFKFKLIEMLSKYDERYDEMDVLNKKEREKKNNIVIKIKNKILEFIFSNTHIVSFREGLPKSDDYNRSSALKNEGHDGFRIEMRDFIERIEEKIKGNL